MEEQLLAQARGKFGDSEVLVSAPLNPYRPGFLGSCDFHLTGMPGLSQAGPEWAWEVPKAPCPQHWPSFPVQI